MKMEDFFRQHAMIQLNMQQLTTPISAVQRSINQMNVSAQTIQMWINQFKAIPTNAIPQRLQDMELNKAVQNTLDLAKIANTMPYTNFANFTKIFDSYEQLIKSPTFKILSNQPNDFAEVIHFVTAAVAAAQPYVPANQKNEYEIELLPILTENVKTQWTVDRILTLISLLVSILFGIVANSPNEQQERIIAQNEVLIEQQKEMIELKKEDIELRNTLGKLINSIDLLTDEVESLRNEHENFNDASELNPQPDTGDCQQQNGTT